MTTLTQSQFARHLAVDRAHVTRLKHAGRLVMTADGRVDVEASEARIAATADPAKSAVAERHAAARAGAVDGQKPPKSEPDDDGEQAAGTPDYQKARARRETANAELAEMESATRAGQLMETALVLAAIADAGATLRTHLATLPAILAPQLATLNDENQVRLLLEDHIEQALGELAERMGKMAKEAA